MYCKKCGTQIPDNASFCDQCGEKTYTADINNSIYPQPYLHPSPPPAKKNGCLIAVIIVIPLIIVALLITIFIPSIINYNKKSKLKTANGNAKTAWFAIDEYVCDNECFSSDFVNIIDEISGSHRLKDKSSDVEKVINELMSGTEVSGSDPQYYIGMHPSGSTFFVQWREDRNSPIGQFSCEHRKVSGGDYMTSPILYDAYKSGDVKWGEYYDPNSKGSADDDNDDQNEKSGYDIADIDINAQNEAFAGILNRYNAECYNNSDHTFDSYGNCPYCSYYISDLNGDGIYELIIQTGSCEADRTGYVYIYNGEYAELIGEFNMWHTALYERSGGLYAVSGQGDNWNVIHLVIDGMILIEEEYEKYTSYDEYSYDYGTDYVEFCGLEDYSLLNEVL